tara:strand:- start:2593 stop:2826 length:234 start_codon:yes stop_codon:yes gene_type:complete
MLMSDLDEIKNIWIMPDGWSVRVGDKHMEVLDLEEEVVAQTVTQASVIAAITEHLETQETFGVYQMMMANLKKPIEG